MDTPVAVPMGLDLVDTSDATSMVAFRTNDIMILVNQGVCMEVEDRDRTHDSLCKVVACVEAH